MIVPRCTAEIILTTTKRRQFELKATFEKRWLFWCKRRSTLRSALQKAEIGYLCPACLL
jgi:hypothetical protein